MKVPESLPPTPEFSAPAEVALSVRQPWAALILAGIKSLELRTWPTQRRGRIWIHAGRLPEVRSAAWDQLPSDASFRALLRCTGGLLGQVTITDCFLLPEQADFLKFQAEHRAGLEWYRPRLFAFRLTQP
ncbi:MAG: ASCH domain-containing protein, partial [Gemmataceae bacterium]